MSGVGTAALFVSYIIAGPFWDRFGSFATMVLSACSFGAGFLGIYLAVMGVLSGAFSSIGAVSLYYFLAGFGSCASFVVCYGVNL
ncbi:hypothetical protein HK100_007269, partial [Physocladia obscura]